MEAQKMGLPESPPAAPPPDPKRTRRFLVNVVSGWAAVGTNLFVGFVLSPYMIRKLGSDRYGVWALVLAVVDYLWLFDLGFRSALLNFTAKAKARGDDAGVNRFMNTSLAVFSVVAVLSGAVVVFIALYAGPLFQLPKGFEGEFAALVLVAGWGWSLGIVLGVFRTGLEAFSLFRQFNDLLIVTSVIRSAGWGLLLYLGCGPVSMALLMVAIQLTLCVLAFGMFRKAFPPLRLSLRLVRWQSVKEMAAYGVHTFSAGLSMLLLHQGVPVLIGHFLPARFVGFFNLPMRVVNNAGDAVSRVGSVVTPNATELYARGQMKELVSLGTYSNRYCYMLLIPLAVFLTLYRWELIYVWVGAEFAQNSARLLPVIAAMLLYGYAAQFCSTCILYGMAKHRTYSRALMLEAACSFGGLTVIIPAFGIFGAAVWATLLQMLNRGLFAPWLLCRGLNHSYWTFMRDIYLRATLAAVPVAALGWAIRARWIPGRNWPELLFVLSLLTGVYYALGFFFCTEPQHRRLAIEWLRRRTARFA